MYNKKQLKKGGPEKGAKTNPYKQDVPYMSSASSYNAPLQRQFTPQEIQAFQAQQNPDSNLENILEIVDPTGISSWDDVYRSYKQSGMSPETYLEIVGALPLLGKVGKLAKPGIHLAKYAGIEKALFNLLPKNKSLQKTLTTAAIAGKGSDTYQAYDQYQEHKKGGPIGAKQLRLDKRTKTSKNIQTSMNEILMKRNEMLFGPPGRRWYKPFDGGGELTPEEQYFQYLQDLEAEKQRVEQTRANIVKTGEKALWRDEQPNILKTKLTPIGGKDPFYCSTRSCEIEKAAGVTIPEDVVINGKLYPKGSPMPIIPGTEQWASNAKKLGYEKIDPKEKQPGDRVFAVNSKKERFHSLIAAPEEKYFSDRGSGKSYGMDYSYWDPRFEGRRSISVPQDVYRYVGNVPKYEEQLQQIRKQVTPSTLPMKTMSFRDPQEEELIQYANHTNNKTMSKSKRGGETPEAFPQQPTGNQLFKMSFIPQGPVGFYAEGGQLNTNMIAFPQQPPAHVFFSNGIPWQPHYGMGGAPCYNCGGPKMDFGGDQFGGNVDGDMSYFKSGGHWIQDATKNMRTDKPCTGSKFGGPDCPPGSKRYNLAKTFRAMAKKEEGGSIDATDQQGYLQQYNAQVKRAIRNNLQPFVAQDAANAVMSMEQNAQANAMQYAAMGMETGMINPQNTQRMQMYQDEMDQLNGSSRQAFGNAFDAGMNMINTANPYMDWSTDKKKKGGVPKAKNGYELAQQRMMGDFPQMSKSTTPNIFGTSSNIQAPGNTPKQMTPQEQAMFAAYIQQMQGQGNQNRYLAPNQQAYYTQGNQFIPYNSNPYMNWRTHGMPAVGYNPQNTYLESFEAKKRFFGPGARKVKMTFRTYRDPMTGQVTQQQGPQSAEDQFNMSKYSPEDRALIENKPYQPEVHDEAVDKRRDMNWFQRRRDDKNQEKLLKQDLKREQRMSERAAEHGPITPYGASPFSAGFPANFNMPAPSSMYGGPLYNTGGDFQDWSMTGRYRMGFDPNFVAESTLYGLGMPRALVDAAQAQKMKEKMGVLSLADNQMYGAKGNRINSKGRWVETGMGTGVMDPNNMQVIQQPGWNFASEGDTSFTRFGGAKYRTGGPVEDELTDEEIAYIRAMGGQVEFLD